MKGAIRNDDYVLMEVGENQNYLLPMEVIFGMIVGY